MKYINGVANVIRSIPIPEEYEILRELLNSGWYRNDDDDRLIYFDWDDSQSNISYLTQSEKNMADHSAVYDVLLKFKTEIDAWLSEVLSPEVISVDIRRFSTITDRIVRAFVALEDFLSDTFDELNSLQAAKPIKFGHSNRKPYWMLHEPERLRLTTPASVTMIVRHRQGQPFNIVHSPGSPGQKSIKLSWMDWYSFSYATRNVMSHGKAEKTLCEKGNEKGCFLLPVRKLVRQFLVASLRDHPHAAGDLLELLNTMEVKISPDQRSADLDNFSVDLHRFSYAAKLWYPRLVKVLVHTFFGAVKRSYF